MPTLPRGRHGLSRAEVEAAQRERIFTAMAEAMAERGYVETPVAEVLRRAGVSRETFYQQFDSKQHCFLAAYDWATDALRTGFAAGLAAEGAPLERFATLLRTYLDALAEDPSRSRLFLVETWAAGADVLRRRLAVQHEAAVALAEVLGARDEQDRFACEALLAAVVQLVTAQVVLDEPAGLAALHPRLVAFAASLFPDR
ncbi:TetR/AcrR family transcriptional regulator [Nocardioides sp. LML1-1-1.1]|uniref:TetR/AcrR family transcriptional regulator n=1 Tax=Nocardioides sp. LML1-1-1.1 TaxID=3135248 RepID=UPI00342EA2E0